MSTAFTSPANAIWQTLLDEITIAYSERRQALGQSAYSAADGKDIQAASYWTTLQNWLETYCTSFIDHDNGPLTDEMDAFLYFTLDNWRAAAGLNASGFRRSVDGTTMLYGQMQAGDAIGPWIFEDLQKGFGALQQTVKAGSFSGTRKIGAANGGDQPVYDPENPGANSRGYLPYMEALSEYAYAGSSQTAQSVFDNHSRIFRYEEFWYDTALYRSQGNITVSGVAPLSHSWKLYLIAYSRYDIPPFGTGATWFFDTYNDFLYAPTDGILCRVEENVAPSTDTSHSIAVGSLVQPSWPYPPGTGTDAGRGYYTKDLNFLLIWDFTNA